MQSDLPKVLHEIGGVPMYAHAIASGATLEPEKTVLVVGHFADRRPEVVISEAGKGGRFDPGWVFPSRLAALTSFSGSLDVLGPVGSYAIDRFGDALDPVIFGALALWTVVPLVAAWWFFTRRKDL